MISSKLFVSQNEFQVLNRPDLNPLQIKDKLGEFDREVGFLQDLSKHLPVSILYDLDTTHGGYIPICLSKSYDVKIVAREMTYLTSFNIARNCSIPIINYSDIPKNVEWAVLRVNTGYIVPVENFDIILMDENNETNENYVKLVFSTRILYIKQNLYHHWFVHIYDKYIQNSTLTWDNLINLLIMVKNAGDGFREVLTQNLPYIDSWTILDTGSTDNTISIIKEVLQDKRGNLYQEPFINFRDSRNRLLELAGYNHAFNVMLDDTYILRGDLRSFLSTIRGDDITESLSLFILGRDVKYGSIRITRPLWKSRYKYTIHEVIDTKTPSAMIPDTIAYIFDKSSDYMIERTIQRKQYDLELLFNELDENPDDYRSLYYIAETYLCMKDYEKASIYYNKRRENPTKGYREETFDSFYKYAVIHDLYLNTEWKICEYLYMQSHEFDPNRCESMFMIGYHYSNVGDTKQAYAYLSKAFKIGIPDSSYGMNIKIEQYCLHLPKLLTPLCYTYDNNLLGIHCTTRQLSYRQTCPDYPDFSDKIAEMWKTMFTLLLNNEQFKGHPLKTYSNFGQIQTASRFKSEIQTASRFKLLCFVVDGGWDKWDGKTLYEKGLGGSETCVVRFAETINKNSVEYRAIVFCNCHQEVLFNNVLYIPLAEYVKFVSEYIIDTVLVNRYTEYLPLSLKNNIKTILMTHDLPRENDIIPIDPNLKLITCLSNWHADFLKNRFTELSSIIRPMSYGIDVSDYDDVSLATKIPYSFIYSSFPNRGLIVLLKLFPRIVELFPRARLNVFCDLEHEWCNRVSSDEMREIKQLMSEQSNTVFNHGWVNGKTLRSFWKTAHIWLYPCVFYETCCLTAWEAGASKTLAITSDLGALSESVGDRGIIISGNPYTIEWQNKAVEVVQMVLQDRVFIDNLLEQNYEWVSRKSYDTVVNDFLNLIKL